MHSIESNNHKRKKLAAAGNLHWLHWGIFTTSILLTLVAWSYSRNQVDGRVNEQFNREAQRVLELVQERMQKYEDALCAGSAMLQSTEGRVSAKMWREYSERLRLELKYPGINGIGVIYSIRPEQVARFLEEERGERPDFRIHPEHNEDELFPITFIEPYVGNEAAVGLDMAHEENRLAAARLCRESGRSQITAPIVLVQDAERTPGFLFYVPLYQNSQTAEGSAESEVFEGMVYAPFVTKKLMLGALARENRHVEIRITDGDEVIFDELNREQGGFDPNPLFRTTETLSMYGRGWKFDVWSAKSFRKLHASSQPLTILIAGLLIDVMFIGLFALISRANRRALKYADSVTSELNQKAQDLESSNEELERFAFIASHDLQEPLRMVGSFSKLVATEYDSKLDEQGREWLGFLEDGAARMQALVRDLLAYAQVNHVAPPSGPVNTEAVLEAVLQDLSHTIQEQGATIVREGELPEVVCAESGLRLLLQNLIANAVKFHESGKPPVIHIGATMQGSQHVIHVRDEGIGIHPDYHEKVFVIFQRLESSSRFAGTGLGLAICKKIIESHRGQLWFESKEGEGTTFFFSLPARETLELVPSLTDRQSETKIAS